MSHIVRVSYEGGHSDYDIGGKVFAKGGHCNLYAPINRCSSSNLLRVQTDSSLDKYLKSSHRHQRKIYRKGPDSGIEPAGRLVSFQDASGEERIGTWVVKRKCNLAEFIQSDEFKNLPDAEYQSLLEQLKGAFDYLSQNRYTFFDAKMKNVLVDVDEEGHVSVYWTDFDGVFQLPDPEDLQGIGDWKVFGKARIFTFAQLDANAYRFERLWTAIVEKLTSGRSWKSTQPKVDRLYRSLLELKEDIYARQWKSISRSLTKAKRDNSFFGVLYRLLF